MYNVEVSLYELKGAHQFELEVYYTHKCSCRLFVISFLPFLSDTLGSKVISDRSEPLMSPCKITALCLLLPDALLQDVEMSPVVLMDQVPRPSDSDDELLDQAAIVAGNVAVGEQASMNEAMIEGDQGQGQMVEQCGDVVIVEAGTSPSHLGM